MRIPLTTRLPPDDECAQKFKCAIGRFIYAFAEIERVMFYSLITVSQMPIETAKAVFTDAKIDKAKQQIKRLRKARDFPEDNFLEDTFNHLGVITRLRNYIAHYGAIFDSGQRFTVSDELWKLEGAQNVYYVTSDDIERAISDLATIRQRLAVYMIAGWLAEPTAPQRAPFPWRYKPSQPTRPPSSTPPKSPKQPRRRRASEA